MVKKWYWENAIHAYVSTYMPKANSRGWGGTLSLHYWGAEIQSSSTMAHQEGVETRGHTWPAAVLTSFALAFPLKIFLLLWWGLYPLFSELTLLHLPLHREEEEGCWGGVAASASTGSASPKAQEMQTRGKLASRTPADLAIPRSSTLVPLQCHPLDSHSDPP